MKLFLKGLNYPCFFTIGHDYQDIDAAKHVLAPSGWSYENLFGRELSIYDLSEFIKLGENDPYFNWERENQDSGYYTSLIQFRIAHYKKYGFGVHAIYSEGKLIGQMGLQVLNEKKDEIEFVIFIGQEYTNKGIGSKLLKFLFDRCKEEGINKICAVIRWNNEAARKVLEKFHFEKIRSVTHYHQQGVLNSKKL